MELALDHDASAPLDHQVETLLRKLIRHPRYQNGECLPDEPAIADKLQVNAHTVRQALDRLVSEGLVERRRNAGARVRSSTITTSLIAWESFEREMAVRGLKVRDAIRDIGSVAAEDPAATRLRLGKGTIVPFLERLHCVDDQPAVLVRSWFHPRLDGVLREDLPEPIYEEIASRAGVQAARADETLSVVAADAEDTARLELADGTPILLRERLVFDQAGRPMEYAILRYRADRFAYSISLGRRIS